MKLVNRGKGVFAAPCARIIDRTGRKTLPIGEDGFTSAISKSVLIDKTMLIADVLDSGYKATLFCRPRRFGKTLNMTMLKAFFEIPVDRQPDSSLFEGTEIWDADGGLYREYFAAYPVIYLSLRSVKKSRWADALASLALLISDEYQRNMPFLEHASLSEVDRAYCDRIVHGEASYSELASSLYNLARYLKSATGKHSVLLLDEYDAPVMAGYSAPHGGYYQEVVDFLKGWLTGILKDGGEVLAFACLTGVQRISKESIFSDLNNLTVSTPLSNISDERFGFTEDEVSALADYLGLSNCMDDARAWYDGYRFGSVDVFNPWSVINYLDRGAVPGVYWANTSSNEVIHELVGTANQETLDQIYALLAPQGFVVAPLDLGVIFPDLGMASEAVWSMLYLAGYVTTDLTDEPDNNRASRPLRIPNNEIRMLFKREIIERFTSYAGTTRSIDRFHKALCAGDATQLQISLGAIVRDSASSFDLVSENSCHLFLLGLCFGVPGYADPVSNREAGYGRFDIQLEPVAVRPGSLSAFGALNERPLVTIELKYERDADEARLLELAQAGLDQIVAQGYDAATLPELASGKLRWGIAFSGKCIAVVCG